MSAVGSAASEGCWHVLLDEAGHAVAVEIAADAELDGRALEGVGEAALVVVARVGHPGVAAGVRLGQRGAVRQADGQPADHRVLLRDVLVPPVGRAEHVVEAIHDGPGRDVLELPPALRANPDLFVVQRERRGPRRVRGVDPWCSRGTGDQVKSEASRRRDPSFLTDPSEAAILIPSGRASTAGDPKSIVSGNGGKGIEEPTTEAQVQQQRKGPVQGSGPVRRP